MAEAVPHPDEGVPGAPEAAALPGDLPAQGELGGTTPLPRLLMTLHSAQFDGALTLTRERVTKTFLFQKGVPVLAESNLASESLSAQLVQQNLLSRADQARVAARTRGGASDEAKVLLALELIEPKGLFRALREQVRLRLVECFGWTRGGFALDATRLPPEGSQPFRVELFALIQEGIEAHWNMERALEDLAPRMHLYPRGSRDLARLATRMNPDEALSELLQALDGSKTLWQLVQSARTPRALAGIWLLDAAGGLAYHEKPAGDEPEEAATEIEIVVARGGGRRAAKPKKARKSAKRTPARNAEQLARDIDERFAQLDELDLYALLEVPEDADERAIKRAYLVSAKRYHPDVIARSGLDADTRTRANRVFAEIGRAYAVLSDPEQRRQYEFTRGEGEAFDAERIATAEGMFLKGEVLLRAGNFKGALEFLEPAVDLWGREAAYQSALGWALYKKLPSEPERARQHLEQAVELDPKDGVALFRLSLVLRALGEDELSEATLARARAHGGTAE